MDEISPLVVGEVEDSMKVFPGRANRVLSMMLMVFDWRTLMLTVSVPTYDMGGRVGPKCQFLSHMFALCGADMQHITNQRYAYVNIRTYLCVHAYLCALHIPTMENGKTRRQVR